MRAAGVEIEVSAREQLSARIAYAAPVFTVLAALAVGGVVLIALGVNPLIAYRRMFVDTLASEFGRTQTLIRAVPLVLTGLAVYLPLRAGLWNIGAEGQLYLGGLAGTWVGLNVDGPTLLVIPLALLGAGIAGGLWGLIPGYLRAKRGVNEIIATLMLTFVGVRLVGYLVRGPMRGGTGGFPGTDLLPDAARLPDLPIPVIGEPHAGVLVAVAAVAVVSLLVSRTQLGYEIVVTGSNPSAAKGAGMNTEWIYVAVLVLGGALAGLAGLIEVAGIQGNLEPNFSPGYGFTAIPIALLGRKGALRVGVAGLFFALLFVGGTSATLDVPAAIVDVIQSLVILFLITAEFFKRYRIELHRPDGGRNAPRPAGEAD